MAYTRSDFGSDFSWGVSTAAYQIEGAHNIDGKGPSIWDSFVRLKGKIFNAERGDHACDFYRRFNTDLCLFNDLHIPNHRFSISWSRILPTGTGHLNLKAVDYYNRLIDTSLERNICPWITLYHWDLPASLQQKGGWVNRDVTGWFEHYTEQCCKLFGDRVKNWIVLNEPMVFTGAGYFLGVHAPGKKGLYNFLPAVHHAALCQADGGRIVKGLVAGCNVGTTISCSHLEPYSESEKDKSATRKADALLNRLFIEPLIGLGYPLHDLPLLKRLDRYMRAGDEQRLNFNMDFIGIQNYTREIVKYSMFTPYLHAKIIMAGNRKVPTTLMNWEVYPEAIYHVLKKYAAYGLKKIIVTENGAAFNDTKTQGKVHDVKRTEFLKAHVGQVLRARNEGVPVEGYFVWTMFDNFEWAEGYFPRFGLVHVDFATQERCIKDSGYWYRDFLGNKG